MNYFLIITIVSLGIIATTLIDSVGSVLSRRLNFNYSILTPLSLITYTLVSYFVSQKADLSWAFLTTAIVCLYDVTIGWKISLLLKANMGVTKEHVEDSFLGRIFLAFLLALIFGLLGNYLA